MSAKNKKTPTADGTPGVPTWMLTYADTVTLLMTFFVMLMSFSTLDEEEYSKVRGSLQGHLGVAGQERFNQDSLLLRRDMESGRVFLDGYENPPEYDPMNYVQESLIEQMRVQTTATRNVLQYNLTKKGFEIHITAGQLFEPGSAAFLPEAESPLNVIGRAIKHLPHHLRVQASGEMLFLRSKGLASRQDLAVARAAAVCRYLARGKGIAAERMQVAVRIEPDDTIFEESTKAQVKLVLMRPTRKKKL